MQVKVPVANVSHAPVHDSALLGALRPVVDVLGIRGIEPSLVAFNRHYERDSRLFAGRVRRFARGANVWQLRLQNHLELALRDTVAEDENVVGEATSVLVPPEVEARLEVLH